MSKACAKIMCMFCLNFETDPLQEMFYGNHARYKQTVDGSINPRRVSFCYLNIGSLKAQGNPSKGRFYGTQDLAYLCIRLRAQSTYYMHVLSSLATITQHTGTRQHMYTRHRVNTSLCQMGCWLELLASNK